MYGRARRVASTEPATRSPFPTTDPSDGARPGRDHDPRLLAADPLVGHYELVDGMLQRTPADPDDPSPPSPELLAAARSLSPTGR